MITFQSRATASVMMFDEAGKQMLDIMGKAYSPEGTITVEQLPQAIECLRCAAAEDRLRPASEDEEEEEARGPRAISLSQRAVPLIDMLTRSLQADEPVIWG